VTGTKYDIIKKLKVLLLKETEGIQRPFGVFLSGGMDSGILAALSQPDFLITCTYNEGERFNELKYARMIARDLNIPLTVVSPRKSKFKDHLEEAVKIIGKPINSISIVSWYNLMQQAYENRMIAGEGADELFGGYSRYLILKQVFELYNRPELTNYKPMLDSLFKGIHSRLVGKKMPKTTDLEKAMRAEYRHTLPDILFMETQLANHFRVKLYRPFMNIAIKRLAAKTPIHLKVNGFTTKYLLRVLASELKLPKEVYRRTGKMGLVCPVNRWMGWDKKLGDFDKSKYLEYQKKILDG
jgi:asparagine synthetase B (glutamine-hydrolysing)